MREWLNQFKVSGLVLVVVSIVYLTAQTAGEDPRYFPAHDAELYERLMEQRHLPPLRPATPFNSTHVELPVEP